MDTKLFRWINGLAGHTTFANGVVGSYATYGIGLFGLLLLVSYFHARSRHDHTAMASSVWAGGAALVAVEVAVLIGGAVDRARPYAALSNVHVLVSRTTDSSFPSDHSTAVGAVAAGLLLTNLGWGKLAAVGAVLMAACRVYAGAHYPGDVLAGLGIGAVVAAAGHRFAVPLLSRLLRWIESTPLRVLVRAGRTS